MFVEALCFFCLEKDGADYKSALGELGANLDVLSAGTSVLCGSRFLGASTKVFSHNFRVGLRVTEVLGAQRRCATAKPWHRTSLRLVEAGRSYNF